MQPKMQLNQSLINNDFQLIHNINKSFVLLLCIATYQLRSMSMFSTANILLANVAGNARHTLIHCLYIVYTLPVVALIADNTRYISVYYL